ncbi:MAG: ABC transporter substrate-binding protein [Xanthobacteraceae bacterium]
MALDIGRRRFIAVLGSAVGWPRGVSAQQPAAPVVGFLDGTSEVEFAHLVTAFRQGLNQLGYAEGRNLAIAYRFAQGQYDRLPVLAADLVRQQVAVIAATGPAAALAAKKATATIPVVFLSAGDVVRAGLVASLNRPGGNATGVSLFTQNVGSKKLELMHELVPGVALIAYLLNPTNPAGATELAEVQSAAPRLGLRIQVVNASSENDLEIALAAVTQMQAGALLVGGDAFFNSQREKLAAIVAAHAVPAIYGVRDYVAAGGLVSYGTSISDAYRQVGIYTARILKGERPADLPVVQPTKFELVINLKAAEALRLAVPATLLATADEVIE